MIKLTSRSWRRIGLAMAMGLPLLGLVVWYWVIPAAIVAAIRERHEGHVAIAGWWIGGSSAGVTGLALHEDPDPSSPTWAAVDRVSTDLSLGALLRGRFTPRRIVFDRASISYRIDAEGKALTSLPMKQSGDGAMPELIVRDGTLAMRQEGRPEMVVHHLDATMGPDPEGPRYSAKANDSDWGHPAAEGRFTPDFSGYDLHLTADRLPADPETARRIPFVDGKIWQYVEPRGPVGVVLDFRQPPAKPGNGGAGQSDSSVVVTTAIFQGTTVKLPTLGLLGEDATGRLTVRDNIVTLEDVKGRMCDGRVAFSGPMDFRHKPDRYDLALTLDGVDLDALPDSWQVHRIGVRGRFTGKAGLRLVLRPEGLDLTGSTGEGVVDGAEVRGIPLERLGLTLRGEGPRWPENLARSRDGEAPREGEAPSEPSVKAARREARPPGEEVAALREARPPGGSEGRGMPREGEAPSKPFSSSSREGEVSSVPVADADHRASRPAGSPDAQRSGKEGPFLPQWIRGEFRVKDVELDRALAYLETPEKMEGPRTVPVSGRVELVADVRFPLGSLEDWKAYTARGTADIGGAQIGGLDLGRLRGRLNMADGVLEIADLRGQLLDRPAGGGRPPATEPPPAQGPLPRGGFRGRVRAEVVGDQDLRVDFEATELPIAELAVAAPTFVASRPASQSPPEPLPIAGRLTIRASGRARGSSPADPRAWTVSGRAEMPEVTYRTTVVKSVTTGLSIDRGRLVLSDVAGRVGEASFKGRLGLDLAGPYAYEAEVETGDLSCRELAGLVPNISGSFQSQLAGTIAGRGKGEGTLQPWRVASEGRAQVAGLRVGRLAIGDVPMRWTTQAETILVTAEEHQRYGGRVSAEARVPVKGDRPIEGTVALAKVDVAEMSSGADDRDAWKLTGHADGRASFRYTPVLGEAEKGGGPPIEAQAHLTAPDLTVGGVPARSVKLAMTVHEGDPKFDLSAEGLGGTIRLTGDGHLASNPKDDEIRARIDAVGLQLYEIWGALGVSGAVADLRGQASLKGHGMARERLDLDHARGQGQLELDELIWGFDYRLGSRLQARVSQEPGGWRVGPMGGEFFGGKLAGEGIWMSRGPDGRPRYGADVRVDRLKLARALSFLPESDRRFGTEGTLRIAGRRDGSSRGTIEFHADRGQINGLQLSELHIPGEWSISTDGPRRGAVHVQRADGRLAGGRLGGEAHFALGDRRDFRARLTVDDVDLRVISRDEMGSRPVPGRLSGYVNVYGTDPAQPVSYRGELDLDLDQASLVDIPLLDELDRSLGSTNGGVFDDGDLHGTISEGKVHIDRLTLVGPLAQVHAQGTVDFDGRLNLEVVVNNNKGVYESGQAMMARAPAVADEVARRASQIDQVRDYVSSRLMKFRITGTIRDPIANVDRSINPRAAIGFFLKTMRLSAQSR